MHYRQNVKFENIVLHCRPTVNCKTLLDRTWRAQVNAVSHCHVTGLFYPRYSTAHSTTRGIVVPRLECGIVNLQPLYFLLNFVGYGGKW